MKPGIDIVHVDTISRLDQNALDKMLHASEQGPLEKMAGKIAAKEAVSKAIGIVPPKWLDMHVKTDTSGKPYMELTGDLTQYTVQLSISHDGEYAVAMVILT